MLRNILVFFRNLTNFGLGGSVSENIGNLTGIKNMYASLTIAHIVANNENGKLKFIKIN